MTHDEGREGAVAAGEEEESGVDGTVRAVVVDSARHLALVEVVLGEQAILSRVTPDAVERLRLAPGAEGVVMFKSVGVEVTA